MRAKLAVIVCHEAKAPGAYGIPPLDMHEYQYGLILADKMKAFAESSPDEVSFEVGVFKRDNIGISGAYNRAISWLEATPLDKAALMEPHFNAAPESLKGKASGTETLLCDLRDLPWVNEKLLAALVHGAVVQTLETRDRGLKQRPESEGEAGWYSLNRTVHYPSILPELFFGDHPGDAAKAMTRLEPLAQNIALAVEKFFWS